MKRTGGKPARKESPKAKLRRILAKQLNKFSAKKQHEILDRATARLASATDAPASPGTQSSQPHTGPIPLVCRNHE